MLPSESALIDVFAVSRATLREALRILESEGLIKVIRGPHGGARVQRPQRSVASRYAGFVLQSEGTTLADLYEARELIEPPAVGRLACTATPAQLADLRAVCDAADAIDSADVTALAPHHKDFHTKLIDFSGSKTVALFSAMIEYMLEQMTGLIVDGLDPARVHDFAFHATTTHRRMVDILEAGDPVAAEEFWRKHLAASARHAIGAASNADTILDLLSPRL